MTTNHNCLILLDAGDHVFFLGQHGEHTTQTEEIKIFSDELAAQVYIDKHGIDHIASIRHINRRGMQ